MIILLGALKTELTGILEKARISKKSRIGRVLTYRGSIKGKDIVAAITGMGKDNAVDAVHAVLSQKDVSGSEDIKVIITGFCGAADSILKVGELVVYSRIIDLTGACNDVLKLPSYDFSGKKTKEAVCGCTGHVVISPEGKKKLFDDYGIGVIDMESYWLVKELREKGLSDILCIRAVSDDAGTRLPEYLSSEGKSQFIFGALKSAFKSIISKDEFRANINAFRNIYMARNSLEGIIRFF